LNKIVILMGSKSDLGYCQKIADFVKSFGVETVLRIASAHKNPLKVVSIVKEEEKYNTVFITVAGRSNALSGFVDFQTSKPVIASPPVSDTFGGADIYSSLRMPSGVSTMVVLEPENAGLAALKILAMTDENLRNKIEEYQNKIKEELEKVDKELQNGKC